MQRREFMKKGARAGVATLVAASAQRVYGANDRVNMALVGCGGRGRSVARAMRRSPEVEYRAVCDVYEAQARKAKEELGGHAETCGDFRQVLERKDIDAVHIATPDHWHAIPAVLACQAGKHVYCEKPLSHNILEGKAIVKAASAAGRVFLTGTQQRSAPHFAELAEMVRSRAIGKIHLVRVWNYTNRMPDGIGTAPDEPVPPGLDWDFYLGPAPYVPFNRKRFLGTYREFSDYAGGRITDFGVHRFDTVHQILGADTPRTVSAAGGRFALAGMGDHPDCLQATYEYPGFVLSYETSSINAFGAMGRTTPGMRYYGARAGENRPNGMAFYGTEGTILADRVGYEILPERRARSRLQRAHRNASEATALHAEHFVRCIRSGETPRCDAGVGHRSSLVAHLGNIAYRTGRKLTWDAEIENLIDAPDASRLLGRKARKPWDLL